MPQKIKRQGDFHVKGSPVPQRKDQNPVTVNNITDKITRAAVKKSEIVLPHPQEYFTS